MKAIQFQRFGLAILICLAANIACLGATNVTQVTTTTTTTTHEQYTTDLTPNPDAWDFRIGLPIWAPGIHGNVGAHGRSAHIDKDFWDLLDTLDFMASLNLEIRKSRVLFFLDGFYFKTSTEGNGLGPFGGSKVTVDNKLNFNDVAIGYALYRNPCFSLEAFAGAQLTFLQPHLTVETPIADRTAETSRLLADPIVGAYINYRLSYPVGLYVKGDAGGFDVSSRVTWQIEGGLDFQLGRTLYVRLAYRYLNIDYQKHGTVLDMHVSGPQLEFGAHF
jgi:hypothetical protein